jgi:hypothetical protein
MSPETLVDTYLQHCEDRELDQASAYLSPELHLQFPGAVEYDALAPMIASPKPYAWVRKHRDRFVVGVEGDDTSVVSIGRLYGERHDGSTFADVRYVDVFVLRGGLITEQLVWNDLCEAGIRVDAAADLSASRT